MTYTLIFTDRKDNVAGIVIASYAVGENFPTIMGQYHDNNYEYEQGWIFAGGEHCSKRLFYERRKGDRSQEVMFALEVLRERIEGRARDKQIHLKKKMLMQE